MGIGGAVLYSLVFMAVRAALRGGAFAARSLRRLGLEFLVGAASHGAQVAGAPLFSEPLSGRMQKWQTEHPEHDGAAGDD